MLFHLFISFFSITTEPLSGAISLDIILITVDLPAPLGPMSDVTFPFGSKKLTSLTTVFSSYFFIIWLICITVIPFKLFY